MRIIVPVFVGTSVGLGGTLIDSTQLKFLSLPAPLAPRQHRSQQPNAAALLIGSLVSLDIHSGLPTQFQDTFAEKEIVLRVCFFAVPCTAEGRRK